MQQAEEIQNEVVSSPESAFEFDDNQSSEIDLDMGDNEFNIDLDDLSPAEPTIDPDPATSEPEDNPEFDDDSSELMASLNTDNEAKLEATPELISDYTDNVPASAGEDNAVVPVDDGELLLPDVEAEKNIELTEFLQDKDLSKIQDFLNDPNDPVGQYIRMLIDHHQKPEQILAPQAPTVRPDENQLEQLKMLSEIVAKLTQPQGASIRGVAASGVAGQEAVSQEGSIVVPSGSGLLVKGVGSFVSGLSQLGARGLDELGNAMRKVAGVQFGAPADSAAPEKETNVAAGLADVQIVREDTDIPDSMLYRMENLRISEEDYQNNLESFWQEGQMQQARDKIREHAEKTGVPEEDIIASINKDPNIDLAEVTQVFNEAYENTPSAKLAKEKMDKSLDDWKNSYASLTEDFGYADPDNRVHQEAFSKYDASRKNMEEATAKVPQTPDQEVSHLEQFKEFMQKMQEKIKELAKQLTNAVKNFFGKGASHEPSPEP